VGEPVVYDSSTIKIMICFMILVGLILS
jgi:hypothetical protein